MGKIIKEYETKYDAGDVVIFDKDNGLKVGIIEGFYIDTNADNTIWYNIRISSKFVYTYSNHGDIYEGDIIGKLEGDLKDIVFKKIVSGIE